MFRNRKHLRFGILGIAVCSFLLFSVIYLWIKNEFDLGCAKTVVQSIDSPNGTWRVTELNEECGGAVGGLVDELNLEGNTGIFRWLSFRRVFSSSLSTKGGYLAIRWNGSSILQITYPDDVDLYTRSKNPDGIQVLYQAMKY